MICCLDVDVDFVVDFSESKIPGAVQLIDRRREVL
jgi:hypothetical protein